MIAAQQSGLKLLSLVILSLGCAVNSAVAQQPAPRDSGPPCSDIDYQAVEVVENLWHFASAGELLNSEGWTHAVSGFFTKPGHTPRDFRVVANRYGISNVSRKGDSVEIAIQSEELGKIDSKLRFITTPTSHMNPDFYIYDLIFGPTPARWYGPDGNCTFPIEMPGDRLCSRLFSGVIFV